MKNYKKNTTIPIGLLKGKLIKMNKDNKRKILFFIILIVTLIAAIIMAFGTKKQKEEVENIAEGVEENIIAEGLEEGVELI